jgi:type II secretory pathway pseudopilin PulG
MNRNVWATILAVLAVIAVLILGFRFLGSPGSQRMVQSDLRRVKMLAELAQQINQKWNSSGRVLPDALENFPDSAKTDPVTGKLFSYHAKIENKYQLCATFATDSREPSNGDMNGEKWMHPKGEFCFDLDASQPVPPAPFYY